MNLSVAIYNKNLKETAFNYCAQWSGADDQKIDSSVISTGVMSHTIYRFKLVEMASTERNDGGGGVILLPLPQTPPQNEPLKSPPRLGIIYRQNSVCGYRKVTKLIYIGKIFKNLIFLP